MRSLISFFAVLSVCWAGAQVPSGGLHVEPVQSVDSQIIGGVNSAYVGEFPSLLSLELNGVHHCGATLLSATYGLTSARCVDGYASASLRVVAGLYNRGDYSGTQIAGVANYNVHELYNPGTGVTEVDYQNDIAILRFSSSIIEVSGRIHYATLATDTSSDFDNIMCTIAGWGSVDYSSNYPATLHKANLPVISYVECDAYMAPLQHWADQICAKDPASVGGACNGDFGGPLLCPDAAQGGVTVVAGVGSWIVDTSGSGVVCNPSYPSVYTRVTSYLGWIRLNTP